MGGLIKQGPLYTTVFYYCNNNSITVCLNEMSWFEKTVVYYQLFIRLFLYHVRDLSTGMPIIHVLWG